MRVFEHIVALFSSRPGGHGLASHLPLFEPLLLLLVRREICSPGAGPVRTTILRMRWMKEERKSVREQQHIRIFILLSYLCDEADEVL